MKADDKRNLVVISPFANERMRDWPPDHFRRFIELALRDNDTRVVVVGTRAQRARANEIVRNFSASDVANACGQMSWSELVATIDSAAYVVANNSGVAHLASSRQRWTLCLFSNSHSYIEWMPRGPRTVVLSRAPACAPCEMGGDRCPNGRTCMTGLEPDKAFELFHEHYRLE
jgi:ADP-heptose:LPS heptosyltransferase